MATIFSQIGTSVGDELKALITRLEDLESELTDLIGHTHEDSHTHVDDDTGTGGDGDGDGDTGDGDGDTGTDDDSDTTFQGDGYVGEKREVIEAWENGGSYSIVGEILTITLVSPSNGKRYERSDGSTFWSNHLQYSTKTIPYVEEISDDAIYVLAQGQFAGDTGQFAVGAYNPSTNSSDGVLNDIIGSPLTDHTFNSGKWIYQKASDPRQGFCGKVGEDQT